MKLVHVAWIKIHIMRRAPDDSVRVHTSVCGGALFVQSLLDGAPPHECERRTGAHGSSSCTRI